jgi:NADH:ubiquinone oxidoreductase subunit 5 (subunit L)/multisubunit Na+/H+ antiporter MnhA subunit
MLIPLAVLALGATFAGMAFRYLFIGVGHSDFWRSSLFLGQENHILEEMETVPWLVSLSPTLFLLAGLSIAAYLYLIDRAVPRRLADAFPALYRFLLNKWYFDELYDFLFVRPSPLGASSGRVATGRSSTALARTACRPAFSKSPATRCAFRPATSIITLSRC